MINPKKNILIAGYYGFHNTGDEAILKSMLDNFRSTNKNLGFTVISGDPDQTSAEYSVNAVHWQNIPGISSAVKASDLIILGGGGLFQEYWEYKREQILTPKHHSMSFYGGVPVLAALHRKPLVLFSLGLGPLYTQDGKELVHLVFEQADLLSVRDIESKKLLQMLGMDKEKIRITGDPAFGLKPAIDEARLIFETLGIPKDAKWVIGVSLRNWNIGISFNKWKAVVANSLDRFLSASNGHIVFIPFQSVPNDDLQDDIAVARFITESMEHTNRVHIVPSVYSPQVISGLIAQCDLLIGMRLHSLIFALQAAIPVVGLSYDQKIDHLLKQFRLEEYLVSLKDISEQSLVTILQHALETKEELQPRIQEQSLAMKKDFTEFSETVLNIMDSNTPSRKTPDFEEFLRLISLDKINQVAKLDKKTTELEILQASDAWQEFQVYLTILNHIAPKGSLASKIITKARRWHHTWQQLGPKGFLKLLWQRVLAQNPFTRGRTVQTSRQWEETLTFILKKHENAKDIVVILPNITWNVSLFQRPQQMALAFAQQGFLVLYLELPDPKTNNQIIEIRDRLYRVPIPAELTPHIYATPIPFKKFERLNNPIVIAYTYNMHFLEYFRKPRVVYEYIDELDVFPYQKDFLVNNHREILSSANVVVATAKRLHDEVLAERPDAIINPNGVDYNHFAITRNQQTAQMPRTMKKILRPNHPVIGYYGALARWFDYDLLAEVARQRPEWDIVLIGIDYDNTLHPSGLLKLPNTHWLGARHYTELPEYLRYFDVATIPFKVNDITHSTSPLKMFEYFAGHKPVVATAMHEVQRYDNVVLIAHNYQEFIEKTELALTLRKDPEFIAKLDQVALDNTWEARVQQIINTLT